MGSGSCGNNLTWVLDGDGVLTISGTGSATGNYSAGAAPWSEYSDKITKIVLPETLYSIGQYAFSGCTQLKGVEIPASVTAVGLGAFSGCTELTEARFAGNAPEVFQSKVFDGCGPGFRIYFPKGKSGWTEPVWKNWPSASYTARTAVDSGMAGENITWTLYEDGEIVFEGRGRMDIPSSVTNPSATAKQLGWYAHRSDIKKATVGENIWSLASCAFYECRNLTDVSLPSTLLEIGHYAFYECRSLSGIALPPGSLIVREKSFMYCKSLKELEFGSGQTIIESNAFLSCTGLENVTFGGGSKVFESTPFSKCTALKSITFLGGASQIDVTKAGALFGDTAEGFTISYMEGQEGWEGETWNNYPIMAVSPGTLEAQGSDALITFTALHTGRCLVAGYDSQGKMIKFLMPTVTSGDKVNLTLTGGGGAAGVKIFYLTNMEYQPKCNAVELKKI